MSISCFCSQCCARIRAPEKAAGRKVNCPNCRTTTVIPALQGEAPSPRPARTSLEDIARQEDVQERHWSLPPPIQLKAASEVRLSDNDEEEPGREQTPPPLAPCPEDDEREETAVKKISGQQAGCAAVASIFLITVLPLIWFSCEQANWRRFIHNETRDMYREMDRQQEKMQRDLDRTFRGW